MRDVSLEGASRGRFEVIVDDQVLFSKAALKRFPGEGEILKLAHPILGPPLDWR